MSEYTLTHEERIGYVARAAAAYGYSKGKWGNDISAGVPQGNVQRNERW